MGTEKYILKYKIYHIKMQTFILFYSLYATFYLIILIIRDEETKSDDKVSIDVETTPTSTTLLTQILIL